MDEGDHSTSHSSHAYILMRKTACEGEVKIKTAAMLHWQEQLK
jgi:hypothetical protein